MPVIVTCTDLHIRAETPSARVEKDWLSVCLGQLEQVLAIAKAEEARLVLCSGDIGDSPRWHPRALVELMKLLDSYKITVVTCLGQHDVYGHNIDTWPHTGVGILAQAKYLTVLNRGACYNLIDGLGVYGFSFGEPETEELLSGTWRPPEEHKDKFKVALVHASVGAKEDFGWAGIEHQNVRGVHLASFGDIHDGFDPHQFKDGALAYSTGALVRSSKSDMGRVPCCAIVEYERNGKYTLDFADVEDGNDADVFNVDSQDAEIAEDLAAQFKAVLVSAQAYSDEHPKDRLLRVGQSNKYTERQINLAVTALDKLDG